MKNNFILIFDDNCPLCAWYSNLLVKFKLLPSTGRVPFTKAPEWLFTEVDLEKAKNKIPLIDTDTKKVFYGIDALVEILCQKLPFVKTVCKWPLVNWFLKKLYKFI